MPKHPWFFCALACLVMAGCEDLPTENEGDGAEQVEAVRAAEGASPVESDALVPDDGISTVCAAYRDRLFELQSRLSEADDEDPVRGEEATFASLLRQSCE